MKQKTGDKKYKRSAFFVYITRFYKYGTCLYSHIDMNYLKACGFLLSLHINMSPVYMYIVCAHMSYKMQNVYAQVLTFILRLTIYLKIFNSNKHCHMYLDTKAYFDKQICRLLQDVAKVFFAPFQLKQI